MSKNACYISVKHVLGHNSQIFQLSLAIKESDYTTLVTEFLWNTYLAQVRGIIAIECISISVFLLRGNSQLD